MIISKNVRIQKKHLKVCTSVFLSLTMLTTAVFVGSSSHAEKISWQQREELYLKGTLTDSKGQTWNVIYIPGLESVKKFSQESLEESKTILSELKKKTFWKKQLETVKNGFKSAKRSVVDSYQDIISDYKATQEKIASIQPGEFGSAFAVAWSWTKFSGSVIGETVSGTVGVLYSIGVEGVAFPLIATVSVPVGSAVVALGGGVAIPGAMYVWNGMAWLSTDIYENEPTRANFFVRLKGPGGDSQKGDLVIDKKGFDALIIGASLKALNREELAVVDVKLAELEKQRNGLYKEESNIQEKLYQNESFKAYQKILDSAYQASGVVLTTEAKEAFIDESKLDDLVKSFLKSLGADATPERIATVKKSLHDNLDQMIKEMSIKAQASQVAANTQEAQGNIPATVIASATLPPPTVPAPVIPAPDVSSAPDTPAKAEQLEISP